MADTVEPSVRSRMMSAVKGRNTKPEMMMRRILHRAGYRFRIHKVDLPGRPDIVLPRHRVVVFVHGCFWHAHDCPRGRRPSSNTEFWDAKLSRNVERDRAAVETLTAVGWRVVTVWECSLDIGIETVLSHLTS